MSFPPTPPPAPQYPYQADTPYSPAQPPTSDPGIPNDLPFPPAGFADVQGGPTNYTEAFADGLYDTDTGLLQIPVAGPPGTPSEIIRWASPSTTFVFEATAERNGVAPQLPSWITNNPNMVLMRKMVMPATPANAPDGTKVHRRSIRYEFALIYTPADYDQLTIGVPAYVTDPALSNNVQPGDFNSTLLDCSSSVPAGFVQPTQ